MFETHILQNPSSMRCPKMLSFLQFYSANMNATFILIYSIKMRYKTKSRFNRVKRKSIVRILRYSICFWPAFFVQAIDMDTAYLTGVRPFRERRLRRCYCQKNCCNTIHSSRGGDRWTHDRFPAPGDANSNTALGEICRVPGFESP